MEAIVANGYNLDIKHPHVPEEEQSHSSAEIVSMLHDSFRKSDELLEKLKKEIGDG
jgi:type I restriction enzyme M protein